MVPTRPTVSVLPYVPFPVAILYLILYGKFLTNLQDEPVNRASKVAPMPAETGSGRDVFPGLSHAGPTNPGSGKGGHEPKSLGENKGTGAQGV